MKFIALITQEGDWYIATAFPSFVTSQGKTIEEAQANLKEALELYYEGEDAKPAAAEPVIASFDVKLN